MSRAAIPSCRHSRLAALALAGVMMALQACAVRPAQAQEVAAGKALYKIYCQVCHSPDPSTAIAPFSQIMSAANNPAQISAAAVTNPSQMGFITTTFTQVNLQDLAAYLGTFLKATTPVEIVEFYHATRDHYFMSMAATEIADLDRGVHPGWIRTGLSFKGFAAQASGAAAVCRFYIPPASGDSHFYSASVAECGEVQAKFPAFTYESPNVFYIAMPDANNGSCTALTVPVYRLWNGRSDTNHRYTTSAAVRQQMLAAGWLAEGYGGGQVAMCAPQ